MNRQERRAKERAAREFVARMNAAKEAKRVERLLPRLTVKVPPVFPGMFEKIAIEKWKAAKAKQAQRAQHINP